MDGRQGPFHHLPRTESFVAVNSNLKPTRSTTVSPTSLGAEWETLQLIFWVIGLQSFLFTRGQTSGSNELALSKNKTHVVLSEDIYQPPLLSALNCVLKSQALAVFLQWRQPQATISLLRPI